MSAPIQCPPTIEVRGPAGSAERRTYVPGTCGEDEQIDEIEDRLVRRARAGDAESYGELARRHEHAALRVATVVLGTAEGADDVVQTALERGWRAMGRFEQGRPFRPWLLQIVANTARNDRRGRGRRARLAVRAASVAGVDTTSGAATPDERAVTDADRRWVVAALNRLAADDRLVLALRHFEHLSDREIADVLGCPLGTAKSRRHRALARLRAQLVTDLPAASTVPTGQRGGGA